MYKKKINELKKRKKKHSEKLHKKYKYERTMNAIL